MGKIIGIVAAIITIFVFFTGRMWIGEIFHAPKQTVSPNVTVDPKISEHPRPTVPQASSPLTTYQIDRVSTDHELDLSYRVEYSPSFFDILSNDMDRAFSSIDSRIYEFEVTIYVCSQEDTLCELLDTCSYTVGGKPPSQSEPQFGTSKIPANIASRLLSVSASVRQLNSATTYNLVDNLKVLVTITSSQGQVPIDLKFDWTGRETTPRIRSNEVHVQI